MMEVHMGITILVAVIVGSLAGMLAQYIITVIERFFRKRSDKKAAPMFKSNGVREFDYHE